MVQKLSAGDIGMDITGAHASCPVCRVALWAPASELIGRLRCPRCSADLWVLALSRGPVFFPGRPGESLADLLIALDPTVSSAAAELEAALRGADQLDVVEVLWEVEEALREHGH